MTWPLVPGFLATGHRAFALAVVLTACVLGHLGCATRANSGVRVFGDDGEGFLLQVETTAQQSLTVGTLASQAGQQVVWTNQPVLSLNLRKDKETAHIAVEVVQDGHVEARAAAPPGTAGVRLKEVAGQWQIDPY